VGWSPSNLVITRFGLNADFINANDLTWIENLETSSGKRLNDASHGFAKAGYVKDYIAEFGVRKCEANALVVAPDLAHQLCRDAITEHISPAAPAAYQRKLARVRNQLRRALRARVP
jgi:hypothetical protein